MKYNAVLRGVSRRAAPALVEACERLCGSNRYTTTLHCINSSVVKLSKLTRVERVYRGLKAGVLPNEFWEPNEVGVRGGVEPAFMSTTTDRQVALRYAASGSGSSLIFELEQGMVDRGVPYACHVLFSYHASACGADWLAPCAPCAP